MNAGLTQNLHNQNADIILKNVPDGLFLDGDEKDDEVIVWEPSNKSCGLRYGTRPGNRDLVNFYPNTIRATGTGSLILNPFQEGLTVGVYYCILVVEDDPTQTSVEFKIIVQAKSTPIPRSPLGTISLNQGAPLFRWDAVQGSPYYFLLLSEGPLAIDRNEDGDIVGLTGLNLIWQLITTESFIQYGAKDPSGNFVNAHIPPLLPNIEYNWVVLNSYSIDGDLITTDVAPVAPSAFQVTRPLLSQSPALLEPLANAVVTSDKINFSWQPVAEATRYRLFLFEERTVAGNNISYIVWSRTTTDTNIELDSEGFLIDTRYNWRIVAENETALATSEKWSFEKQSSSSLLTFIVTSDEGPLMRVKIDVKNENDSDLLIPFVTDSAGVSETILPVGDYSFRARREGFLITDEAFFSIRPNSDLTIEVQMERSQTSISGQIVSELGEGIFDAKVDLQALGFTQTINADALGFFTFAVNPGAVAIRARKAGFVTTEYQTFSVQNDQALDISKIQLESATNLVSGTVSLADDGRSLQGAILTAGRDDILFKTTANNQGGYRFELGPGEWSILAESPGLYASPARFELSLEQNQQVQAPFQMFSGGLVNGSIFFNGQSIENVEILAFDIGSNDIIQTAVSNLQGNYSMGLPPGNYIFTVSSTNFIGISKNINIAAGQTITENFELTQAGFVEGQVFNSEINSPAIGVRVFAVGDTSRVTVTDNEGNYRLSLPPGNLFQLDAFLLGFQSSGPLAVTTVSGETITDKNFVLTALSGIVRGQVTDGVSPVPDAEVQIGEELVLLTDANGRFETEIAPGRFQIKFTKECHLPGRTIVDLAAGQTLDLNLALSPLTSEISGRVVDVNGFAISDVIISAQGDTLFSAVSDAQGFYALCLNGGLYRVTAERPGYFAQDTVLVVGDGDFHAGINFRLEESFASLRGTVRDFKNDPVAGAVVEIKDAVQTRRVLTDLSGKYTMEKIIAGSLTARAKKSTFYGLGQEFFLQEKQAATLDLVLYPANGSISGRVFDTSDSSAIPDVDITATFSSDRDTLFKVITRFDGSYSFSNLPVINGASFQIFAFHDEYANSAPVTNVAVDSPNIDFFLIKKTGMISGEVVDRDTGSPVPGARVEASNATGNRSIAFGDMLGKFSVENLAPGSFYNLNVSSIGYFSSQNNTAATGDTTVKIELNRKYGFVEGALTNLTGGGVMSNVTVTATPLGATGLVSSTKTGSDGKYRLSLAADFYNVRPVFPLFRNDPNLSQVEVAERDTIRGINFTLEEQNVASVVIQRKDKSERPSISYLETHCYEAIARDENNRPVVIGNPTWSLDVSSKAGSIDADGCLGLDSLYFGDLKITAEEPSTGITGELTVQVFAPINETTEAVFFDDRGLQLQILRSSVVSRKDLFVSQSKIAAAKKGRAEYFMTDLSYVIGPTGLAFEGQVRLMLPAPINTTGQRSFIARWKPRESIWELMGSSESGGQVSANIQDAGEYVALAVSKPLDVKNLRLTPNPFSPYHEIDGLPGLKIEVDIASNVASNPLLTVKIYNLEGNRIRLLYDQIPFPRGESVLNWDGRADDGSLARNGRYIVRAVASDPKGKKEQIKSVVLIK